MKFDLLRYARINLNSHRAGGRAFSVLHTLFESFRLSLFLVVRGGIFVLDFAQCNQIVT